MSDKEKLAKTEGFEMAIEMFGEMVHERIEDLYKEVKVMQDGHSQKMMSRRTHDHLIALQTRCDELVRLTRTIKARIEKVPQEVKPEDAA